MANLEQQQRLLLARGLIDQVTIQQAMEALPGYPGLDLLGLLEQFQRLDAATVQELRSVLATSAISSSAVPISRQAATAVPPSGVHGRPAAPSPPAGLPRPSPTPTETAVAREPSPAETDGGSRPDELIVVPSAPGSAESRAPESRIGRYEVLHELARGGMGRAVLAHDPTRGCKVVIKRLLSADAPEPIIERLMREAEALRRLDHLGIVRLFEAGRDDEGPYMVLEHVEGETLEAVVQSGLREQHWLDEDTLRSAFIDLAGAIEAMAEEGIVHRDITPANLLIAKDTGRMVLIDFGVSRRLDDDPDRPDSLTMTGQMVGTPGYLAPEQVAKGTDLGEVSAKTDVWGFGATLFFALTGEPPMRSTSLVELAAKLTSGDIPRVEERRPDSPRAPAELVRRCLQRDPGRRPEPAELAALLKTTETARTRSFAAILAPIAVVLIALAGLVAVLASRDTVAPKLALSGGAPAITAGDSIELLFKVEEAHACHVVIAGRRVDLAVGQTEAAIVVPLKEGQNRLEARAIDEAGNVSAAVTVTVTRDSRPPIVTAVTTGRDADGRFVVRGEVDEGGCRPGEGFKGQVTGRTFEIAPTAPGPVEFELLDAAGNRTRASAPVTILSQAPGALNQTLPALRPDELLLLPPGVYTAGVTVASPVRLEPLRFGTAVTLRAESGAPLATVGGSGVLTIAGLALESTPACEVLMRVKGGRVALTSCALRAAKVGIVIENSAELDLNNVTIDCGSAPALAVKESPIRLLDCAVSSSSSDPRLSLVDLESCPEFIAVNSSFEAAAISDLFDADESHAMLVACRLSGATQVGFDAWGSVLLALASTFEGPRSAAVAVGLAGRSTLLACDIRSQGIGRMARFGLGRTGGARRNGGAGRNGGGGFVPNGGGAGRSGGGAIGPNGGGAGRNGGPGGAGRRAGGGFGPPDKSGAMTVQQGSWVRLTGCRLAASTGDAIRAGWSNEIFLESCRFDDDSRHRVGRYVGTRVELDGRPMSRETIPKDPADPKSRPVEAWVEDAATLVKTTRRAARHALKQLDRELVIAAVEARMKTLAAGQIEWVLTRDVMTALEPPPLRLIEIKPSPLDPRANLAGLTGEFLPAILRDENLSRLRPVVRRLLASKADAEVLQAGRFCRNFAPLVKGLEAELGEALSSPRSPATRRTLLAALAVGGHSVAARAVLRSQAGRDLDSLCTALHGLLKSGDPERLVRSIELDDNAMGRAAVRFLAVTGKPALEHLQHIEATGQGGLKDAALAALMTLDPTASRIKQALKSSDPIRRAIAICGLAHPGYGKPDEALTMLHGLCAEGPPAARCAALHALAMRAPKDPAVKAALDLAITDPSPAVRRCAVVLEALLDKPLPEAP